MCPKCLSTRSCVYCNLYLIILYAHFDIVIALFFFHVLFPRRFILKLSSSIQSFITKSSFTTYLILDFDSMLAMKDESMVNIFQMLEESGLRKFIGCGSLPLNQVLDEFFKIATVEQGNILCTVGCAKFPFSQKAFAYTFDLPSAVLYTCASVLDDYTSIWRSQLSLSGGFFSSICKKNELKVEFWLTVDIVAKPLGQS